MITGESDEIKQNKNESRRRLGTFGGVFCAIVMSQFSSVIFLRLGFIVGQSGLLLACVQILMSYILLTLTVLSVCAISTNGAIEGGGVYFMLTRTLGPEFGGAIGTVLYFSQICSSAHCISGFVEALVANFGPQGLLVDGGIPFENRWWGYLYATCVMMVCLFILLIGSEMFARVLFAIWTVVVAVILCTFGSFFRSAFEVPLPRLNALRYSNNVQPNATIYARFTGLQMDTLKENVLPQWATDYTTDSTTSFMIVFSILFSGVAGITKGANMSGELRNPARSIPAGTLLACLTTFLTYILFSIFVAASCSRDLLQNNYVFLQGVNIWSPMVVIGIFATTLSAALAALIGASRILEAIARDELFGVILRPVQWTTKHGNPIVAVLVSCLLVQLVLLLGHLNTIAPIVAVLCLLCYASINFACLAMDTASAANFRPTFRYFNWVTALFGMIGSLIMCLLIEPVYSLVAMTVLLALVFVLQQRHLGYSWGSISQALIFHQVRKYLLLLDERRPHVKYWRPQLILLVSNPRHSASLVQFMNSLKKGGLYVIGHAIYGDYSTPADGPDPCVQQRWYWHKYAQLLKVKAFVEVTLDVNIRRAISHLVRTSGLGAMRPNTVCLGFYDNEPKIDILQFISAEQRKSPPAPSSHVRDSTESTVNLPNSEYIQTEYDDPNYIKCLEDLPAPFNSSKNEDINSGQRSYQEKENTHRLTPDEYVSLLREFIHMEMNIIIARNFDKILFEPNTSKWPIPGKPRRFLEKHSRDGEKMSYVNGNSKHPEVSFADELIKMRDIKTPYFDIWPVDLLSLANQGSSSDAINLVDHSSSSIDLSGLFLLQLACLVARSPYWRNSHRTPRLRVFYPIIPQNSSDPVSFQTSRPSFTLSWLKQLIADLRIAADIQVVTLELSILDDTLNPSTRIKNLNQFVLKNCQPQTTALFVYLPRPRQNEQSSQIYLDQIDQYTRAFPPTLLACGLHEVISTSL